MAAPLGNLVDHNRKTALELYADSLQFVGTCIAPKGELKEGQEALRININETSHVFNYGELTVIPMKSESLEVELVPLRLDLGAGRGKVIKRIIRAGKLGLIIDTRGRPMARYRQSVKLLPFEALGRDA
jgi:hypothetical protein